jgi:hypothetical protein
MLVHDQPLATAPHPNGAMPAVDFHRLFCLQRKRQTKRQGHPSNIASARDLQVIVGR